VQHDDKATAFPVFYHQSAAILARYVISLGKIPVQDRDDIIQETYVEAYKGWDSLLDPAARIPWLLTIGRRRYYRSHRKRSGVGTPSLTSDGLDATLEKLGGVDVEKSQGQDQELITRSIAKWLLAEIELIPCEKRKKAVEMFYLEEENLSVIASELNAKTSTITTWLSRFRKSVKERADALLGGEDSQGVTINPRACRERIKP
jgi:RNA polymerase sigma factor (sigma-70 family)